MKAAIIQKAGARPIYGDFAEPTVAEGAEIITVTAAALSQFSKSRSSGQPLQLGRGVPCRCRSRRRRHHC